MYLSGRRQPKGGGKIKPWGGAGKEGKKSTSVFVFATPQAKLILSPGGRRKVQRGRGGKATAHSSGKGEGCAIR